MNYSILAIGIFVVFCLLYFYALISPENTVIQLLETFGIKYRDWDRSGELFGKLVRSVENGEVTLEPKNSGLILHTHIAVATIRYKRGQHWSKLREFHQIGDDEVKPRDFDDSIGVRIRTRHESATKALQRKIAVSLGSSNPEFKEIESYALEDLGEEILNPIMSGIYPGLIEVCHREHFTVTINERLYQHKYIENRSSGKVVYFRWVEIKIKKPQDRVENNLIKA